MVEETLLFHHRDFYASGQQRSGHRRAGPPGNRVARVHACGRQGILRRVCRVHGVHRTAGSAVMAMTWKLVICNGVGFRSGSDDVVDIRKAELLDSSSGERIGLSRLARPRDASANQVRGRARGRVWSRPTSRRSSSGPSCQSAPALLMFPPCTCHPRSSSSTSSCCAVADPQPVRGFSVDLVNSSQF
jgi:hypothetical protein